MKRLIEIRDALIRATKKKEDLTNEDIGIVFNLTGERIRQITRVK